MSLFPVEISENYINVDHEKIAKHCIDHVTEGRTTFHNNEAFLKNFPDKQLWSDELLRVANAFLKRTNRRPIKSKQPKLQYWGNVYREGDSHDTHSHGNTIIAGSYYPVIGEPAYPITFESPWHIYCGWDTKAFKDFFVDVYPKAGHTLMWAGWLNHRVGKIQNVVQPRISVSFNISYNIVEAE